MQRQVVGSAAQYDHGAVAAGVFETPAAWFLLESELLSLISGVGSKPPQKLVSQLSKKLAECRKWIRQNAGDLPVGFVTVKLAVLESIEEDFALSNLSALPGSELASAPQIVVAVSDEAVPLFV